MPPLGEERLRRAQCGVGHLLERDDLLLQHHLAARDAGHVEQVVDHAAQPLRLPLGQGERLVPPDVQAEQPQGVAERREGVAQLVGEHAEERVLSPALVP